jgi:serine protease
VNPIKLMVFVACFSILSAQNTFASKSQRYIVSAKSQTTYSSLKNQLQVEVQKNSKISLEYPLDQLQVLIVDSDLSIEEMQHLFQNEVVEPDVLSPSPKPISNFFQSENLNLNLNDIRNPTGHLWNVDLIRASDVWSQGFYGQGTRVMMLDTGVDKDHPSIKDQFEKGKNFAGGVNRPYPFFDSVGHGTHTTGIVVGSSSPMGFIGVAPQAKFLMARVCSQTCSSSAVLKGLNWALEEKVDVVNMSLSRPQSSQAEISAIAKLEAAGIVVVASSGNDGKQTVFFPAALQSVIAVGSINEDLNKSIFSNWGPELDIVAPGANIFSAMPQGKGVVTRVVINGKTVNSATFVGAPRVDTPFVSELIDCGDGRPASIPANVKGKTAFMKRGEIKFIEKLNNAVKAGASAVIFYNNEAGLVEGDLHGKVKVPVALIEQTEGERIKAEFLEGKKMDSAISNTISDYGSNSGTSMATPHVTGVVALMLSKNKLLTPLQIRDFLIRGAKKLQESPQNFFGSGLVDANDSINLVP